MELVYGSPLSKILGIDRVISLEFVRLIGAQVSFSQIE